MYNVRCSVTDPSYQPPCDKAPREPLFEILNDTLYKSGRIHAAPPPSKHEISAPETPSSCCPETAEKACGPSSGKDEAVSRARPPQVASPGEGGKTSGKAQPTHSDPQVPGAKALWEVRTILSRGSDNRKMAPSHFPSSGARVLHPSAICDEEDSFPRGSGFGTR